MFTVVRKKKLTPVTKLFEISAPIVARKAQPGQFVIVRVNEQGERIPLTIADFDREKGTVTIIVQEVGKTTRLLGQIEEGQQIADFVGPLGQPAQLRSDGTVACVGGGFGVAPVFPIARELKSRNVRVVSIIGARTAELVIMESEMRSVSDELHVTTDDGSYGRKGLVTDVLKDLIDNRGYKFDEVIAIGPMVMMKAVAETTRPYGIKTWVSVDPIMVDGTGMCGACRVSVGGETKFACVHGPIFDAHQVDFDLGMKRTKMYVQEEKLALNALSGGEK